ncbi:MAG: cupin domain-containing protein [Bacteroidota bacterium]|nr:cupin domain-containing protein [Bacteroidota bacterium]
MKKLAIIIVLITLCQLGKSQYNKGIVIEPLLKTDTTSIGQKIVYPQFANDEITIARITIPPGDSTGWHKHEFPVFAVVLEGTLTIELKHSKTLQFSKNTTFSEVINTLHNGVNKGKENVVLIGFFMGEKGKALSVHNEPESSVRNKDANSQHKP